MYIHEAVAQAMEAPSAISRPNFDGTYLLVTNNPYDVIYGCHRQLVTPIPGWEPTVDDLLANDWVVTRAEGLEWPSESPMPILRSWKRFFRKQIQ